MKAEAWLKGSRKRLIDAGIATARLDTLVLLEDSTKKDRSYILSHPEYEISSTALAELNQKVERRANHEPLAYIRNRSEFYGREFKVTPATLQPRPETETMVEIFLEHLSRNESGLQNVIDVGTGSGAIAITVKLERPKLRVIATDINNDALEIAQENAKKLGADVMFYESNLLATIPPTDFQLLSSNVAVLANLPYVPKEHTINKAAMYEPALAIFGGADGLDLYRKLFMQIKELRPSLVLTESLPFQHEQLSDIAKGAGYKLSRTEDFIQVFEAN